jgi:signal peptidase I
MDPTMTENQFFIVSAWPYVNKDPKPGDIIVFKSPEVPTADYVQRIAAAGGSTIEIKDGISSDSRIWGFLPRRAVIGRVNL